MQREADNDTPSKSTQMLVQISNVHAIRNKVIDLKQNKLSQYAGKLSDIEGPLNRVSDKTSRTLDRMFDIIALVV